MKRFKDTMVAPGSNLWDLMHAKGSTQEQVKENKKAAEKQYDQTTEAFNKLYSKESQEYFAERQREYFSKNKPAPVAQPETQTVKELTQ